MTTTTFQISEAAHTYGLSQELIYQFIQAEWVIPIDSKNLLLDEEDIARIQLISELKEKLGVNDEGVSVILHLIDQLNYVCFDLKESYKY